MNTLVAGLLTSALLVSAPGIRTGDYVFPRSLPGNLKIGNQVVAEVTVLEYLTVLQIKGGWLWVESHDLLTDEPGERGWIADREVDNIDTQIDYVAELAARDPPEAAVYAVLGLLENLGGDPKGGITSLTRAIAVEPANEFYYYLRGYLWIGINQYQKALDDFTQAASLIPGDATYLQAVEMAEQLVKNNRVPAAPPDPTKHTGLQVRKAHQSAGTLSMTARANDKRNKQVK